VGYDLDGDDAEAVANKKVYEVEAVRSRRFNKRTLQYEYELKWLGWPEAGERDKSKQARTAQRAWAQLLLLLLMLA
jgi:hypothetical protein